MPGSPPLKTKLFIPQIRHDLVPRPRLTVQIAAGVRGRLTLISAPPGFGKTTALAEWAAQHPLPLAWVSLDAGDNDPLRFLAYLLYALEGSGIAALSKAVESLPLQTTLERLVEELATAPDPCALALDDYHVITAQPVHDGMAFLLEHLPPQVHLIIASRADPPIPLARLRARGELTELRADELRFTPAESAAFLEQVMGLSLKPEEIAVLETRTEGWIAGLQLAALSMRGRADIPAFIHAFSGSHRFILDYLVEEVIERQPAGIQRFLLRTSLLERLSGPLCDALLEGRPPGSAQATLEYLEKANLFLAPLDDERRWYRYHHLFAELLQARLKQDTPDLLPVLHLRAAAWLAQNGFPVEAVQHALAAGDFERAAALLERHAQERWSFSDLTFLALLERLPEEMLMTRPKLGFYYAWVLITRGQLDACRRLLDELVKRLAGDPSDVESHAMRGFIELLYTYIATLTGKTDRIRLPGREALEIIPAQFLAMRNSADVVYALLLSFRGDFEPAAEILLETTRRDLAAGGTTAAPISIALLARLRSLQGHLHAAAELCREYIEVVESRGAWRFYLAGNLHIALGEVLREWNDLDGAEGAIRSGMRANQPWAAPEGAAVGYIALARLQHSRGDMAGALETLAEAERFAAGRTLIPDLAGELRAQSLYLRIASGDLDDVQSWAAGLSLEQAADYRRELDFMVLSRLYMAQGDYAAAQRLLEQLAEQAKAGGRSGRLLKIDLLRAQALYAQKRVSEALAQLEPCLELARAEGYTRSFLDEGGPVGELLAAYLRSPIAAQRATAKRLLDAFPVDGAKPVSQPGLVEPLTRRELEVLRLICAGRSNQEIAAALVITLNTVKRHNNSIFSKLGVSNRARAIVRAQELNLA